MKKIVGIISAVLVSSCLVLVTTGCSPKTCKEIPSEELCAKGFTKDGKEQKCHWDKTKADGEKCQDGEAAAPQDDENAKADKAAADDVCGKAGTVKADCDAASTSLGGAAEGKGKGYECKMSSDATPKCEAHKKKATL